MPNVKQAGSAQKLKYNYQKSVGFRQRLHIGAALAHKLPTLMEAQEVAAIFGISTQMLRRIECLALYKVKTRLIEALKNENLDIA